MAMLVIRSIWLSHRNKVLCPVPIVRVYAHTIAADSVIIAGDVKLVEPPKAQADTSTKPQFHFPTSHRVEAVCWIL